MLLHSSIIAHEGMLSSSEFNELSGLLRLSHDGSDIVPRHEILEDLDQYTDPERSGKQLFIARVIFNSFDDAELAGFATTYVDGDGGGEHIDRLFVHPTSRGRRLGKQLVQACVQHAAEHRVPYVQYDREPASDAEERVFRNLNFTPDNTHRPLLSLR